MDSSSSSQASSNLRFQFKDDDEVPYVNTRYIAWFEDGTILEGTTDENGYTEIFNAISEQKISVHLDNGLTNITDI